MLHRLTGLLAVFAVAATPALAQSRLVCRYTGEAIADCPDQGCPAGPLLADAGCCEERATAALPAANPASTRGEVIAPALVPALVVAPRPALAHQPPAARVHAAHGSGPPVFLVTKALLI